MLNADEKAKLDWKREVEGMVKIEALGLYAVAKRTLATPFQLADGSGAWTLEQGETFPFLGFTNNRARVWIGKTFFEVPSDAVDIVKVADNPQVAAKYQQILTIFLSKTPGGSVAGPQPLSILQKNDRARMLYVLRDEKYIGSIRAGEALSDEQILALYTKALEQRRLRGIENAIRELPR